MPNEPNETKEERKKARQEKRELRKKERTRKRESGENKVGEKILTGVKVFFKGVWKVIKGFCKYILFPFWYTGVLVVRTIKFLRVRNKEPLTEENKSYLSLIPSLFFSMSLAIAVIFLLFRFKVFDEIVQIFINEQFWYAVGQIFVEIGQGIVWWVNLIFVQFFYDMIILPLAVELGDNLFWSSVIFLGALVILTGLGILLYNLSKRSQVMEKIVAFLKKIFLLPKRFHDYIRQDIVLKHLVGERYIENRKKNFFWSNVLIQTIITLAYFGFAMYLGISQYFIRQSAILTDPNSTLGWGGDEILRYAIFSSLILFGFIGVFSTWFFSLVHGVSTMSDEEYEENKKRKEEKKQNRIKVKQKK
ncbi:MAG: hypothetical protein KGD64_10365 [Candidatus Heimdallarchaeota archaeon]|nr:hypothetical protein [Candidatus Heimdallarchaeota archaeon]